MLLDGFVRPVRRPQVIGTLREFRVGTLNVAGVDRLFERVRCITEAFDVVVVDSGCALRPRRAATPEPR